jgi:RND superfamily putative drug exporter
MVAVFGAFALGDFVLVQILGVALAAAVVLDATLVRLAVGPALLALAGRWNWWPAGAQRTRAAATARPRRAWPAADAARPTPGRAAR